MKVVGAQNARVGQYADNPPLTVTYALRRPWPALPKPVVALRAPAAAAAGVTAALGTSVWATVIDGLARQMRAEGEERSDHVHYGGATATDKLFAALGIGDNAHILDLCSGEGGPARHLAEAHPALRITCIELDSGNVERASATNARRGLAHRITTHATSADTLLAVADNSIDGIIGLDPDAFAYADRARMCAELHRVAKPGAKLVLQHWALAPGSPRQLNREFDQFCTWGTTKPHGVNADAYVLALQAAGFDVRVNDVRARYANDQLHFVSNLLKDHGIELATDIHALFARAQRTGVLPRELSELRANPHFDWPVGMLAFAATHGIGVEIHARKR
jgi:ubiquinone/menaquinone biosynthesis C-methylase UbiE